MSESVEITRMTSRKFLSGSRTMEVETEAVVIQQFPAQRRTDDGEDLAQESSDVKAAVSGSSSRTRKVVEAFDPTNYQSPSNKKGNAKKVCDHFSGLVFVKTHSLVVLFRIILRQISCLHCLLHTFFPFRNLLSWHAQLLPPWKAMITFNY